MFTGEAVKAAFRLYVKAKERVTPEEVNARTKAFISLLKAEQARRTARKEVQDNAKTSKVRNEDDLPPNLR